MCTSACLHKCLWAWLLERRDLCNIVDNCIFYHANEVYIQRYSLSISSQSNTFWHPLCFWPIACHRFFLPFLLSMKFTHKVKYLGTPTFPFDKSLHPSFSPLLGFLGNSVKETPRHPSLRHHWSDSQGKNLSAPRPPWQEVPQRLWGFLPTAALRGETLSLCWAGMLTGSHHGRHSLKSLGFAWWTIFPSLWIKAESFSS